MNTSSIEGWTTSTKLKEIEGGSSSSDESSDDESDTSTDSSSVTGSETETIQLAKLKTTKNKKSRTKGYNQDKYKKFVTEEELLPE